MRISISGPQCTGKTTLLNEIEECSELREFTLIKEVVRTLKKASGGKLDINKSSDFVSQEAILTEHHKNSIIRDMMITDRGSLDAFVYATYNYLKGGFTFSEWAYFEDLFLSTINRYDAVIYLPANLIKMEEDGVRATDLTFQQDIHILFLKIIDEYKLGELVFPFNDLGGRLAQLLKIVRNEL